MFIWVCFGEVMNFGREMQEYLKVIENEVYKWWSMLVFVWMYVWVYVCMYECMCECVGAKIFVSMFGIWMNE